jgi:hypothetical protein
MILIFGVVFGGSVSYRYLKEKYGVISGSGAQAQNGNGTMEQ